MEDALKQEGIKPDPSAVTPTGPSGDQEAAGSTPPVEIHPEQPELRGLSDETQKKLTESPLPPEDKGEDKAGGKKPTETPIEPSQLVVHAKELWEWQKEGGIGAENDEFMWKMIRQIKEVTDHLPPDDPNLQMAHKLLRQLYTQLEAKANTITKRRDERSKQGKDRYKAQEMVEQEVEVVEDGKKIKKKVKVPGKKEVEDQERIFTTKEEYLTAVVVLDQQQLIFAAALEQMLSNNGTRPIEITLPSQEAFEHVFKQPIPGVPKRFWDWVTKGYRNKDPKALAAMFAVDAVTGASTGLSAHLLINGKSWEALGLTTASLIAQTVNIILAKDPRNIKFISGEPGESLKLIYTAPKAEGRVIRTYVDLFGELGWTESTVIEHIGNIEKLRTEIFARAGLDLQDDANKAMLRLDLTSLDPGANTLSGGSGEIPFYSMRQHYLRKILETEHHHLNLAELTPEEQLEAILKAYNYAATEYCGDIATQVLDEQASKKGKSIKSEAEVAFFENAQKRASGELTLSQVTQDQVDNATLAFEVANKALTRLKTDVEDYQRQKNSLEGKRAAVKATQALVDQYLEDAGIKRSEYPAFAKRTEDETRTLRKEIKDLKNKLSQLESEDMTKTGRNKVDVDEEIKKAQADIDTKGGELQDKEGKAGEISKAMKDLLTKQTELNETEDKIASYLDGELKKISSDVDIRKDFTTQDEFVEKEKIKVQHLNEEMIRLSKILTGGEEAQQALKPTEADILRGVQLGYLAAVGLTDDKTLTIKGKERKFQGRYNSPSAAIISQEYTLSELSSRTKRGFQLWQEMYFGSLTPDKAAEVAEIFTMGEMAMEIVDYIGLNKRPNPRLQQLLSQHNALINEIMSLTEESQVKAKLQQIGQNEMELYFEVVPRLGVDRFETAEFSRHMQKRLVEKAKTGEPRLPTYGLSRFEKPSPVREIGESVKSKFGTATVEEPRQVERVRQDYGSFMLRTPDGFQADGMHDTPLNMKFIVNSPESSGPKPNRLSLEYSLVLTPSWWDALPATKGDALGRFPLPLIDTIYGVGAANTANKKRQEDISEMGNPVVVKQDFDSFNDVEAHLDDMEGLGGVADPLFNYAVNMSRIRELTYKSLAELVINGDSVQTTRYFERFATTSVSSESAGSGVAEQFDFRWTYYGFEAYNITQDKTASLPEFFIYYEEVFKRTRGIDPVENLSDAQVEEMNREIEGFIVIIGRQAMAALQR